MENLLVKDFYTPTVITVASSATVVEALSIMREKSISSVIIADNQKPLGIFTERDAVRQVKNSEELNSTPVTDVMSSPLIEVGLETGYIEAYGILSEHQIRHIVVTNQNGLLEGIITESDFLQHLGSEYLVQYKEVSTLMNTKVKTLRPQDTVYQAIEEMDEERYSCIVIEEEDKAVGIFTERDIVQLDHEDFNPKTTRLQTVMTSPVLCIPSDTAISDALAMMDQKRIRRLVVESPLGKISGLLTRHDIVRCLGGNHIEFLRDKIIEQDRTLKILEQQLVLEKDLNRVKKLLTETQHIAHTGSWELILKTGELYWSEESYRIFEEDSQQFTPSFENFIAAIHPEDKEIVAQAYQSSVDDRTGYSIEHRLLFADGRIKYVQEDGKTFYDDEGNATRSIGTVQDITERKLNEAQLLQYAKIFNNLAEGVMITDAEQNIIEVNPTFSNITGYSKQEVLGRKPNLLQSGKHDSSFYQQMWQELHRTNRWEGEVWNRKKDGELIPEWMAISCVKDSKGNIINYIAVFTDISIIKKTEKELRFLAHHDSLTKLPNRTLLNERLMQSLKTAHRTQNSIAILFIDLDRFKEVNDNFGHPAGDQMLLEVAHRLQSSLRAEDTVARVSGDEFVILLENIHQPKDVTFITQNIIELFVEPFMINDHQIRITASIGITMSPNDGATATQLLRNADTALYRVKEQGRNSFAFFSEEMATTSMHLMHMRNALHSAIENEDFIVHYQPQIDISSGQIIGTEALVRWQSKQMGEVMPDSFISIAEDTGLIIQLGNIVLRQACQQMKTWLDNGAELNNISVNLSARQLASETLVKDIISILDETELEAHYLELEVTESTVMQDEENQKTFDHLQALGIKISIDDFGTGHSSLTRLKHLPISKLKIDRSFIQALPQSEDDGVIVRTVIGLAENLGLEIIAEGTETQAQIDFLKGCDCDMVQGFFFSKPVPADELKLADMKSK